MVPSQFVVDHALNPSFVNHLKIAPAYESQFLYYHFLAPTGTIGRDLVFTQWVNFKPKLSLFTPESLTTSTNEF